jgi:parallel beta-helix repeat protein
VNFVLKSLYITCYLYKIYFIKINMELFIMKIRIILVGIILLLLLSISSSSIFGIKTNNEIEPINEFEKSDLEEFKQNYVSNELIVKFKDNILIESIKNLFLNHNIQDVESINKKSSRLFKLNFAENTNIFSIINKFKSNFLIDYIEPNYLYEYKEDPVNDRLFYQQWHLENSGTIYGKADCDIDAPEAWEVTNGSEEVVIAIIDSGIDYTHNDLKNKIWINPGEDLNGNGEYDLTDINFKDDDNNGYIDDIRGWDFCDNDKNPMDFQDHGTHCAGIAAAETNNNDGIAGVARNCKLMALKNGNDDGITTDAIIEAIYYAADNGADIISMSFGSYYPKLSVIEAIDYAYSKEIVLASAAGNDRSKKEEYPSSYHNVIAVAATDGYDTRASFSNYGDWIDVAAPGDNIISTIPGNEYEKHGGTSMACPVIAGVAALIRSVHPELSNDYIFTMIRYAVDDITYYDNKIINGGRINAYKAVTMDPVAAFIHQDFEWRTNAQGLIDIVGTANAADFQKYILEIKRNDSIEWTALKTSQNPIQGKIFTLNTNQYPDGHYTIRLRVVCNRGEFIDYFNILVNNVKNTNYVKADYDGESDGSEEKPYIKIKDAVLHSGPGDKVFVKSGTYKEKVSINRGIELIGEDTETVIIDAAGHNVGIQIENTENVKVEGFTIINSEYYDGAIYILLSSDVTINNNILKFGIDDGIEMLYADDCTISNNFISECGGDGIYLPRGRNNNIINNEIYQCDTGIHLGHWGIYSGADENIIRANYVHDNDKCGITVTCDSNDNLIYRNIFTDNKADNAYDECNNQWDNGYTNDGCGNFYGHYTGPDVCSGPKQNKGGSDNIIDEAFTIPGSGKVDHYPLVSPDLEPEIRNRGKQGFIVLNKIFELFPFLRFILK